MFKKFLYLILAVFICSPLILFIATTGDMRWLQNLSAKVEELTPEFLRPKKDVLKSSQNWLVVPAQLTNNYFKADDVYVLTQPADFKTYLYATGLGQVSMLTMGEDGALYFSIRDRGQVLRLVDEDGDRIADFASPFATNLRMPTGLEYSDGWLYISVSGGVVRVRDENGDLAAETRETIITGLPVGLYAGSSLHFDSMENLYLSVPAPCDACVPADPRSGSVLRFASDGSAETLFASGLRAVGGFHFLPDSGALWAGEGSRTQRKAGPVPDEINLIEEGKVYGWPTCFDLNTADREYLFPEQKTAPVPVTPVTTSADTAETTPDTTTGSTESAEVDTTDTAPSDELLCGTFELPRALLPELSGPAGMEYIDDSSFPTFMQRKYLLVLSGPYDDRKTSEGYKIVMFDPAAEEVLVEDFISGWLVGNRHWGKPVDVVRGGDGILYIADQYSGSIFQVVYTKK
ncbi:hypothetical protein AUK40_06510 [Candidatus Wirthbacteria bacterium CG2_30_54_11]|uniref:Glucose/Sorbosone dehydrogenase domain-containing protein n=1 Tax=Candidatus Wirthbacteria bacterium CG2_30_54_11 TaxID=1817892 RepID=A0A1J5IUK3_9BACT|nr:MAG: hypothetical protein AUK40_06510 [Candidatus Wirthbacteria bacterium CG2_30_54_11]